MWLLYTLLSAVAAEMVGIFGKMGLKTLDKVAFEYTNQRNSHILQHLLLGMNAHIN